MKIRKAFICTLLPMGGLYILLGAAGVYLYSRMDAAHTISIAYNAISTASFFLLWFLLPLFLNLYRKNTAAIVLSNIGMCLAIISLVPQFISIFKYISMGIDNAVFYLVQNVLVMALNVALSVLLFVLSLRWKRESRNGPAIAGMSVGFARLFFWGCMIVYNLMNRIIYGYDFAGVYNAIIYSQQLICSLMWIFGFMFSMNFWEKVGQGRMQVAAPVENCKISLDNQNVT